MLLAPPTTLGFLTESAAEGTVVRTATRLFQQDPFRPIEYRPHPEEDQNPPPRPVQFRDPSHRGNPPPFSHPQNPGLPTNPRQPPHQEQYFQERPQVRRQQQQPHPQQGHQNQYPHVQQQQHPPPPLIQQQQQQQQQHHPPPPGRGVVFQDPSQNMRRDNGNQEVTNTVQGGTLRTWSRHPDDYHVRNERLDYKLQSNSGRPIEADVEVWQSPNYAPQRMKAYSQDGTTHPWNVSFESPNSSGNTMTIRNTGPMEFPIQAGVDRQPSTHNIDRNGGNNSNNMAVNQPPLYPQSQQQQQRQHHILQPYEQQPTQPQEGGAAGRGMVVLHHQNTRLSDAVAANQHEHRRHGFATESRTVDGGDIEYFKVPAYGNVERMEVILESDGLPITACIELWQGPGNIKQIAEVHSDNGLTKPFRAVIETPANGTTRTICIENRGPLVYPLVATVRSLTRDGNGNRIPSNNSGGRGDGRTNQLPPIAHDYRRTRPSLNPNMIVNGSNPPINRV